ncbi:MAG: electron transfer flavoprotein subunit alpha/FixB family protein [Micrococcales bacterium]|nr:electron transfer flavoprotein subunit alpha/FixB family protein [Micrococcales bacterium]
MTLVLVEIEAGQVNLVSEEAVTFARSLGPELGEPLHALVLGPVDDAVQADCARLGVDVVYRATNPELERYAAAAWASALDQATTVSGATVIVASGSPRGTEVLAHLAARRDVPMAANVVSVTSAKPLHVSRQVVGGAALEEMDLSGPLGLFSVAGHAVEAVAADSPGDAVVTDIEADLTPDDLRAQLTRISVRESVDTGTLTKARVVVAGGRGAGSSEGFGDVEALAARLGGAVGASRVVTSLGWRPHHEQVGQTGSRITPDLYIACGISGAIQHWAGCASSKTILAINTDADAPMMTKADYAVVGDMHEVLPAILEELDKA